MTLWPRIREALEDGPGTAAEIAVELGLDSRLVSVNLRAMWIGGHVVRERIRREVGPLGGPRSVWCYAGARR